jgi:hypothetical protein
MPPNHWTQRWPMDRILGIGLIVFFTVTYGGEYLAIRSHRGADAFVAPTATSPMVAALPIAPAQAGGAPEAAAQNTAAVATPAALDTIKLADGRVLVGRIQLRDGAELGFTVAPSVAGRYAVTRELLSSGGDASCEQAAAVIRAALPSEETILHVPGSSEFTMSSRPGVRGHLDRDGRFDTPLMSGEKDGIHYSFRMSGRFTVGGFRAESESTTESVVRYRESQSCRFVAALTGTRLP